MSEAIPSGPAFPIKGPVMTNDWLGMSLRDYFAAKAMQALATNPEYTELTNEKTAQWAYQMADAMLEAREP